jgi:hypothetical protein
LQGLPTRGQRTHANKKTPKRLHQAVKNFPFRFNNTRHRFKKTYIKKKKSSVQSKNKPKKPVVKKKLKKK